MAHTTHLDYEGFGVYEFSGGPALGGMGQFPSIPGGVDLEQFVTVEGGLQIVKPANRSMAIGLLDNGSLDLDQEDPNAPRLTGQAAAILGTIGSGWASDYLAKGYVILIDKVSAKSGAPQVLMTKEPLDVAGAAKVGAGYVVVDGPAGVIAAAQKALAGGQVVPTTCPPGSIFNAAAQRCVAEAKTNGKVAIALYAFGGAAALWIIWMAMQPKKRAYAMNRRRR